MCTISFLQYMSMCLFISLSFVCVVYLYVGTCPPICHIHVHYFPPLHVRQSVCDTHAPCPAHMSFCLYFVSVCQYTCLSVTFIPTISSIYVCVSVFLRPYVRISCLQLCVRVSVCHIHVYYTSLSCISATVCRSTCLCACLFSCRYITCRPTVVCYIRAPSHQYVFVCLAVHSSKFRLCL